MPLQNIIELGFSPDITKDKVKILESLNEVYKSAQKLDGLRIELKFTNSIVDFKRITQELQATYEKLNASIAAFTNLVNEQTQAQQKAAEVKKADAAATAQQSAATTQNVKSVQALNAQYTNLVGTIEQNIQQLIKEKAALAQNKAAQAEVTKAHAGSIAAIDAKKDALIRLQREEKVITAAIREQQLIINSQAKELIAAEDSYDQLNAKLLQLERTWKGLNRTEREGALGVGIQKDVAAARAELTKLDETIGNHQRKVGNYASGWNGLGNSINQLTRELPAFANSLQTGFMGISNNIPILADEIKRIRLENKALRLEGKPTESVLKQLSVAFFSWGTALSLGVTLLTLYGKDIVEFVGSLFKAKGAIDEVKLSQEALNKALESTDYKNAVENVAKLTDKIKLAKEGFIDKKKVVKEYNDAIGKTTGKVNDLETAEKELQDNKDAFIEMMAQKAAATYAYQQYAEKSVEAQKKLTDGPSLMTYAKMLGTLVTQSFNLKKTAEAGAVSQVKGYKDAKKEAESYKDVATKIMTDIYEQSKKLKWDPDPDPDPHPGGGKQQSMLAKKMLEAQKKANEAMLQQQAILNKAIVDGEEFGYAARLGFLKKYNDIQQQIIADNAQFDLQKAGLTAEEKLAIQQEAASKSLSQTAKFLAADADLKKQAADAEKAQDAKTFEDMKTYDEKHKNELQKSAIELRDHEAKDQIRYGEIWNQQDAVIYTRKQADLVKMLHNKEITQREYEERQIALQREYAEKAAKSTLEAAKKAKALAVDPNMIDDLTQKIADLELQLEKFKKIKKENSPLHDWAKKMTEDIDSIIPLVENLSGALSAINDIGYNNQKAELDELAQKVDDNYAKEQENIANSTLSEEQKADKLKILEAKHDAQKQAIEKREKQAAIEKAQFDRLNSIAGIILNTARGVTSALAMFPPNIPLAISIGVIGAAQLAAAVATKVPKYAEGTDDHPGGSAIVGEGKHKELVVTPDGKISLADRPTFLDLPKHSKVIPITPDFAKREGDYQLSQIMRLTALFERQTRNEGWEIAAWQTKQLSKIYGKSQNKTTVRNNINIDFGWTSYVKRNVKSN